MAVSLASPVSRSRRELRAWPHANAQGIHRGPTAILAGGLLPFSPNVIVYPAIDIYEGRAVRMTRGDFATVEQVAASPLEAARRLVAEGAEWLHIIDLDGSRTGKPANLDHIRVIANRFTVKIQAGGGIRDFDTAEAFAEAGATRIVVGTAAIRDPELIDRLVDRHADGLAVSVDARNGMVTTAGWTQTTDLRAVHLLQPLAVTGVPTVIYAHVSIDGTLQGLALP